MGGERRQSHRYGLALPAGARQGQGEEGADRVVELVRPGFELFREQRDALIDLPEVAQRARQLDDGLPASESSRRSQAASSIVRAQRRSDQALTACLSFAPGEKRGDLEAAMCIGWPVDGLVP